MVLMAGFITGFFSIDFQTKSQCTHTALYEYTDILDGILMISLLLSGIFAHMDVLEQGKPKHPVTEHVDE